MSAGSGAQGRMLAELEQLKERAGMSFAQLQTTVPYSRSALHRYFTGQAPIPRDALVSVARACDGDVALLVRLWEAAQSDPEPGPDSTKSPAGPPDPVVGAGSVGSMALAAGGAGRTLETAAEEGDPSQTRQRAIRAWFALAFVIVAIMAVRPLIEGTPQS